MADLVSQWKLEETGTPTTFDDPIGGNDGAQQGGTWTGGNEGPGSLGNAISNNHTNSRIFAAPVVNAAGAAFDFVTVARFTSFAAAGYLCGRNIPGDAGSDYWRIDDAGNMTIRASGNANSIALDSDMSLNEWLVLILSRNAANLFTLTINDVEQANSFTQASAWDYRYILSAASSNPVPGSYADIRHYSTANLTAAEKTAIYREAYPLPGGAAVARDTTRDIARDTTQGVAG